MIDFDSNIPFTGYPTGLNGTLRPRTGLQNPRLWRGQCGFAEPGILPGPGMAHVIQAPGANTGRCHHPGLRRDSRLPTGGNQSIAGTATGNRHVRKSHH